MCVCVCDGVVGVGGEGVVDVGSTQQQTTSTSLQTPTASNLSFMGVLVVFQSALLNVHVQSTISCTTKQ